jgi:HAD superfamily hydrolase (TIGR01549 family)
VVLTSALPASPVRNDRRQDVGDVRLRAVVFDVGETIVDETRAWSAWADWLGVPRLTLFSVLGGVIERGDDHRVAFETVRPGIDVRAEFERQRAEGKEYRLGPGDLYPDALPAMRALRELGYRLGVAANQPITTEDLVAGLPVEIDLIASSDGWGVAKPDPRFFERIGRELGLPLERIAYVGDRVDNDVRPVAALGMAAIHIRRGPWGFAHAGQAREAGAVATIDSLLELPGVLAAIG